jgi:putative isomerase
MITYSVSEIPFSLPGSFLNISTQTAGSNHRLVYRTCSGRAVNRRELPFQAGDFFEITLMKDGLEIPYEWTARPHRLDLLAAGDGHATFTFADAETLLFETHGVDLRLLPLKSFAVQVSPCEGQLHLVDSSARGVHKFRCQHDTHLVWSPLRSPEAQPARSGDTPMFVEFSGKDGATGALRFTRFEGLWDDPLPDMDNTHLERQQEYETWLNKIPQVPEIYRSAAEMAWFLLWVVQVPVGGALTRPVMYMSKSWMNAIWAWDNCFNALAVARSDPRLAWNQLLLFFDHQDLFGMVPDMITDLEPVYAFTKPPIQGWTIRKLVSMLGMKESLPYLEQLYKPLSRLTEWWYLQRDYDHDGMPQYHHGNDSGWDNATLFDQGFPTEGADLAAHLVLQCEALSFMAEALGKKKAAERWSDRARQQLTDLVKLGVKNGRFFSPLNGQTIAPSTYSLLNYIPLELGRRLPPSLLKTLTGDLSPDGPYLTKWGLATESPSSPKYEPDGYWRGPIWGPSTYLIFDGLVDAGKFDLAQAIAQRFCDLCVHDPGFWENYDALTGKGLRCPGYSWTAAVFLLLAEWLGKNE